MRAPTAHDPPPPGVIRFQGVRKAFRRTRVLDGVDLEFAPGDRIALIGSNGAGKTTLIRCLLGQYGHEGSIRLGVLEPRRDRQALLREVGFVPQLPPPLKMPVGRLVQFAASLCGTDPARIHVVAARLGLDVPAIAERQFVRLSGGMKQKILIAIALGRDASVLVMDEPAANLDPDARRALFELLAERTSLATMIISSHRLDEVASLVNRVVELDRGRVVLDDLVAGGEALDAVLACQLSLRRPEPALARTLVSWGLAGEAGECEWHGAIASADRLRFIGMLARYMPAVASLSLEEQRRVDA